MNAYKRKSAPPGYASLPARRSGGGRIDRNQIPPKSPDLRQVIIACNRAHPAPSALRTFYGSSAQYCALEATRTQSIFAGV
jgi:hypothetical protein